MFYFELEIFLVYINLHFRFYSLEWNRSTINDVAPVFLVIMMMVMMVILVVMYVNAAAASDVDGHDA